MLAARVRTIFSGSTFPVAVSITCSVLISDPFSEIP